MAMGCSRPSGSCLGNYLNIVSIVNGVLSHVLLPIPVLEKMEGCHDTWVTGAKGSVDPF